MDDRKKTLKQNEKDIKELADKESALLKLIGQKSQEVLYNDININKIKNLETENEKYRIKIKKLKEEIKELKSTNAKYHDISLKREGASELLVDFFHSRNSANNSSPRSHKYNYQQKSLPPLIEEVSDSDDNGEKEQETDNEHRYYARKRK